MSAVGKAVRRQLGPVGRRGGNTLRSRGRSRQPLNPNLSQSAVDEMLIQHLLTIRLFDTIFDNPDFIRPNVIAGEVEKVIAAPASRAFNREQFLKRTSGNTRDLTSRFANRPRTTRSVRISSCRE